MTTAKITLYQFEECPFCTKVRVFLKETKLSFKIINVAPDRDDPLRKELLKKSGVPTVPVISIDGKYIGDSQKIIDYLQKTLTLNEKTETKKKPYVLS